MIRVSLQMKAARRHTQVNHKCSGCNCIFLHYSYSWTQFDRSIGKHLIIKITNEKNGGVYYYESTYLLRLSDNLHTVIVLPFTKATRIKLYCANAKVNTFVLVNRNVLRYPLQKQLKVLRAATKKNSGKILDIQ